MLTLDRRTHWVNSRWIEKAFEGLPRLSGDGLAKCQVCFRTTIFSLSLLTESRSRMWPWMWTVESHIVKVQRKVRTPGWGNLAAGKGLLPGNSRPVSGTVPRKSPVAVMSWGYWLHSAVFECPSHRRPSDGRGRLVFGIKNYRKMYQLQCCTVARAKVPKESTRAWLDERKYSVKEQKTRIQRVAVTALHVLASCLASRTVRPDKIDEQ